MNEVSEPDWRSSVFLLLSGFPGGDLAWASVCSSLDPFLAELGEGRVPEDFPDLRSCDREPAADLAEAMAAFIAARPRTSDEIAQMVRTVRNGYRASSHSIAFNKLATHLEEQLAQRRIKFTRSAPGDDGFGLLDTLASQVSSQTPPAINPKGEPDRLQIEESRMLSPILAILVVLTLVNSGALAYLLYSKGRATKSANLAPELLKSIGLRLSKLESSQARTDSLKADLESSVKEFLIFTERFAALEVEVSAIDRRVSAALTQDRDRLRVELKKLAYEIQTISSLKSAPVAAPNTLSLEREVLREAWRRFQGSKERLAALESAIKDGEWLAIREPLLFGLPEAIPEDSKAAFATMLAPVRDFHNLVTKLSLIPRLVNGELPALESEAQEALRIRELMGLLIMAQNSGTVADQLNFNLRGWLENEFLGFADRFLQRFQQARLEGDSALFEKGYELILQVLRNADLAPIDLVLGKTLFDSSSHAEVSPAHFPNLPDGVIIAVVRNGFVRGGQEVVRQAEVIVNRVYEAGEES